MLPQNMLLRNIEALMSCDDNNTVYRNVDMLIRGPEIAAIGPGLDAPAGETKIIDASGMLVYPGLVNTHHHFFQAFVRNRVEFDWTRLDVMQWLDAIYPVFARVDEDCIYHASVVSMAELIKHGCTTAFDHQYNYSRHAGPLLIDRQIEAAQLLGMRYHGGRGCNTLPLTEGSTIPDAMLETTEMFLADCERLIDRYHQAQRFGMQRIVVAPCQPVNSYRDTFIEAARLARAKGVSLHTHLGEGENPAMEARWGMRSLAWCEQIDFIGADVWLAHGWELRPDEIARMAQTDTGLAHCPAPVFLVGAEITDIPAMFAAGVRIGLGVDGQASNDASNLLECVRLAYLLQCLGASKRAHPVPAPHEFLRMATVGGARCLNRDDIGSLEPGKAADFFCVDASRLDYVGAAHDPAGLPAKVGIGGYVDMTVINGRIVWRNGEFPGLDEQRLAADAAVVAARLF